MILIDTNLWLYASLRELPHHVQAKRWLEDTINAQEPIALPWNVVLGVLRISTQARLLQNPLRPSQAMELVDGWLQQSSVDLVEPGPAHWTILCRLIGEVGAAGNLTSDAHLAALAIEHDWSLCSADSDFRRFPGLRWFNPLV